MSRSREQQSAGARVGQLVQLRLGKKASRRGFLKSAVAGAAAATSAGCKGEAFQDFFRKHYRELTDDDKKKLIEKIEKKVRETKGVDVHVEDPQPLADVEFAYALDLTLCNGNRRCVEACARENNLPDDIRYIRVIEMPGGSMDLEHGNHQYDPETVPRSGKYYLPVQCQQCDNPPCVRACPCAATWKEPDGLVVIDYDWCIGCRYCMAACPYYARRFNFHEPDVPPSRINPKMAYLSNRLRPIGVVEKCTFCLQRTRKGRYPACLAVCPTGARKFGNLNDPTSEVRRIIKTKRVYVLKEDLGTHPRFFYYFT